MQKVKKGGEERKGVGDNHLKKKANATYDDCGKLYNM